MTSGKNNLREFGEVVVCQVGQIGQARAVTKVVLRLSGLCCRNNQASNWGAVAADALSKNDVREFGQVVVGQVGRISPARAVPRELLRWIDNLVVDKHLGRHIVDELERMGRIKRFSSTVQSEYILIIMCFCETCGTGERWVREKGSGQGISRIVVV